VHSPPLRQASLTAVIAASAFVPWLHFDFGRLPSNAQSEKMDDPGNCNQCKRPLTEIDHYGERLIGCKE